MKYVLIVDDHEENIYYLRALMESQGWQVEAARHGAEALTKARQNPPQLIISDLLMPVMDGYTLLRHCRIDERLRPVPFIVYTATYTSPEDERLALDLGADAFILKPTEPEIFLQRLREVEARPRLKNCQRNQSSEESHLREYSETLIRKLDEKTLQLQESNRALLADISERQRLVDLQQAIMDALPAQVVLLDPQGYILKVNQAWREFALANGYTDHHFGVGQNYLTVTQAGGLSEGEASLKGLRQVLDGQQAQFSSEYFCPSPEQNRWFRMMVSPLREGSGAVVMHVEVTERVLAEERLRASESLLKMGERAAKLGSWAVDYPEMRLTWSDQICEIHEVPPGTVPTAEQAIAFYAPQSRPVIAQAIEACRTEGTPFDLELEILTARGRRLWIRSIGEAIRDTKGHVKRVQGAFQDISDLKQAAEESRVNQERYRLLARVVQDAIWDCDLISGQISWNEGAASLTGSSPDNLASNLNQWLLLLHPEEKNIGSSLEECIRSEQPSWSQEHRFRREDGTYAWVLDRVSVIRDSSQKALRLIGSMTDLTDQRKAQERIAEQAALIDQARDAIIVHDLEHHILSWSQGAQRVYGWSEQEVLGQSLLELLRPEMATFESARKSVLETGVWSGETNKLTRSAEKLTLDSRWTLLRDAQGRPRSILTLDSDITDRKKIEAQFLRAQRLESIGTLAGGVAHDLNNVLSPILMSISLLKLEETDEEKLNILSIIDTCAQRGAEMVKQVLTFARGVEGQRLPVPIAPLVQDVIKIIKDTFPKNIQLRTELAEALWEVEGDATQLHQVLLNLAVNARDAMPLGGTLRILGFNQTLDEPYAALSGQVAAGNYLCLRLEDSGTGMPPDILDKIFDPFFTTKEIGQGTGLGLSTSLAIVKSHDGFIRCYSEPGKGTRFDLYLPARQEESAGSRADKAEALPRGQNELILVVDDEESVRQVTKHTLETFGYRVVLASDGAEAVAVFADLRDQIQLVLTDMMMPIMDGNATIHALLRIKPNLVIVTASGLDGNGAMVKASHAGVKHFLPKPYTAGVLLKTLRQALS